MLQGKLIEFSLGQVLQNFGPSGGPLPTCSTPRGCGHIHGVTGRCERCKPFNESMGQLTGYYFKEKNRSSNLPSFHRYLAEPSYSTWQTTTKRTPRGKALGAPTLRPGD